MREGAAKRSETMSGPISPAQRRAIFAAAESRGLSIDDVRDMTPAGSISRLTWQRASNLLDSINRGTAFQKDRRERPRSPRRPKGVMAMVSEAQHRKIESLRIDLSFTTSRLHEFLAVRHYSHGGSTARILTAADGIEVIELLKAVAARKKYAGLTKLHALLSRLNSACSTEAAHEP